MLQYIFILFIIFTTTTALNCPSSAGEALLNSNKASLLECNSTTLKSFYNKNDCCIVNIAECNSIAKAWWLKRNILQYEKICEYEANHTEKWQYLKRRYLLRRIINRKH